MNNPLKSASLLGFSVMLLFTSCQNNNAGEAGKTDHDFGAPAQETSAGIAKTNLIFQDTLIDFGTKPQGEIISLEYKFKNAGSSPLIISDVRPSCGCTIADYPKEPIAPGEEGVISAEFDTNKSDKGSVQKLITVFANDAQRDEFYLLLQGTVTEPKY